jgi:hypothetical protein
MDEVRRMLDFSNAHPIREKEIPPYYMSLNHSISGGIVVWPIFIIVGREHLAIVNELIAQIPTSCVSMQVFQDDFSSPCHSATTISETVTGALDRSRLA